MTSFPKQRKEADTSEIPTNFELTLPLFLERGIKPLTLAKTRERQRERQQAVKMATSTDITSAKQLSSEVKNNEAQQNHELKSSINSSTTVVAYTEEDIEAFKENLVSKNTRKSTEVAVRRFKLWHEVKYKSELDIEQVSVNEAPQLLKHFFLEIRQTTKEKKGKEYEPGTLQTYRNGLRRYFLERKSPPAIDNFDIDKVNVPEFEEAAGILSMKKKDLKKKGLGGTPNAAKPLSEEDVEKMWSSGAVGLQSPRSLLRLVWWNNMMHLGMRGFQEQRDCQLQDFIINDSYIEYVERQTKNRQGNEENYRKRARKYNNKIWKTDGGERDPYRAFIEYVEHRPKGDNVPGCFFLSPVDNPKTNVWYKKCPVGVNQLRKMMAGIKVDAGLEGRLTNSSGRKTAIQCLREEFSPLEIAELTGHANSESISSYSHNPLQKQRKMSNKLSGYQATATTTNVTNDVQIVNANPTPLAARSTPNSREIFPGGSSLSSLGHLSGFFTESTFNNSPVHITINLQATNMAPTS